MATFRRITVLGVLDSQDIVFDLKVSPFFIVGPNGTGKSTALKILHFLLTSQWRKLKDMPFAGLDVEYDDDSTHMYVIQDLEQIVRIQSILVRSIRRASRDPAGLVPTDWKTAEAILLGRHKSSVRINRNLSEKYIERLSEEYESNALLINTAASEGHNNVLYFPTYRRVERDLKELFEDDESSSFENDEKVITPEIVDRFQNFGEVVGFGGQDIREALTEVSSAIADASRKALNEHSVRFLEVLSTGRREDTSLVREMVKSKTNTDRMLSRITALSELPIDEEGIRSALAELREKLTRPMPGRPDKKQEMLLFYLVELIGLTRRIDELSSPLRSFAGVIDKYLTSSKLVYVRDSDNHLVIEDHSKKEIELDQLSSGEKQILAFFTFFMLKDRGKNCKFVIIDEPELSLSVSWQKTLIGDLLSLSPNSYIVSATHSPFIFDRFPMENVKSLGVL
ncbi:MAG: hypothetical protein B7X57_09805 [Erythrobacter sp. 34-65-8]|nr:MAG: hypothetical protein B7X57_09805 [Erythrobacter sp. 34-65-8]